MASLLRNKIYKVNPVTKSVLLLFFFGGWACFSTLSSNSENLSQENKFHSSFKDRILLSLDDSNPEDDDMEGTVEEITTNDTEIEKKDEQIAPTNISCLKPAVTQFPNPVMNKKARQHGGVIIHILVATYMFIGLAIVCDDYFVPSLTRVSDAMNLSPDVAGATFMAAGSSAPELATSVIGVFVAKGARELTLEGLIQEGFVVDDIGISGVVGSAVFNITLVIAVCALSAKEAISLNWYSVCRDCFAYLVCIIVLICTIANRLVSWPEATFFLILYVLYCVAMGFNSRFEVWARRNLPVPESWRASSGTDGSSLNGDVDGKKVDVHVKGDGTTEVKLTPQEEIKEFKEEEFKDPLKKPLLLDDGKWAVFSWYVMLPLTYLTVYTIPDCRKKEWHRWFLLSFFCSVFWICLYSYIMVWMITVIGFTFGIPDTVMGLTFIAAGVSVPDALSGIAVVREGHGDMAVSNAIGSNVFDILVCLGIPWFIQTVFIDPGSEIKVLHKGIVYSTFTLFSTVVFLILASHYNGWKMDRKYGIILLVWYFVVMVFASLYETNILGNFNPVECESNY